MEATQPFPAPESVRTPAGRPPHVSDLRQAIEEVKLKNPIEEVVRERVPDVAREVARITDVRQSARGYANYQEWIGNTRLEQQVTLADYSVSNRGLRSGLVGTPAQVAGQIRAFERAGVDLLLLQFSPQYEEMERFAATVLPLVGRDVGAPA